jgi:HEPN domain-containing protein
MSTDNTNIDADKIVRHWVETSEEDFQTMLGLFQSKSYGWALFLGHISIEKLLKAVYVKKYKKHSPFLHNLYRLAELSGIELV